jgi:cobalamin biosynthesis protein CbiG
MPPEHQAHGEPDDHHGNVVALARAIRAPIDNVAAARTKRDAPSAALVSTKVTPVGLQASTFRSD